MSSSDFVLFLLGLACGVVLLPILRALAGLPFVPSKVLPAVEDVHGATVALDLWLEFRVIDAERATAARKPARSASSTSAIMLAGRLHDHVRISSRARLADGDDGEAPMTR